MKRLQIEVDTDPSPQKYLKTEEFMQVPSTPSASTEATESGMKSEYQNLIKDLEDELDTPKDEDPIPFGSPSRDPPRKLDGQQRDSDTMEIKHEFLKDCLKIRLGSGEVLDHISQWKLLLMPERCSPKIHSLIEITAHHIIKRVSEDAQGLMEFNIKYDSWNKFGFEIMAMIFE